MSPLTAMKGASPSKARALCMPPPVSRGHATSGLPPACSSGLGVRSVSGRIRSPFPAAKISARIASTPSRRWQGNVAAAQRSLDQGDQRRGFRIAVADLARVRPDQGQVLEIAGLAIAIPEPAEDAEHFDVALQAHQIEAAAEDGLVHMGQSRAYQLPAIVFDPGIHALFGPLDIAIAQQ